MCALPASSSKGPERSSLFQRNSTSTCLDSAATFLFLIFTSAFSSKQSLTSVASLMNSSHCARASSPAHGNGNAGRNGGARAVFHLHAAPSCQELTRCCGGIIGYLRKIHKAIGCQGLCPALGPQRAAREESKRRLQQELEIWSR